MQVTLPWNVNVVPSTVWRYSNWPFALPSAYLRALNVRRLPTSTPNTFGNGIVQWTPPFAAATTLSAPGAERAQGTESSGTTPAIARMLRRRMDPPSFGSEIESTEHERRPAPAS